MSQAPKLLTNACTKLIGSLNLFGFIHCLHKIWPKLWLDFKRDLTLRKEVRPLLEVLLHAYLHEWKHFLVICYNIIQQSIKTHKQIRRIIHIELHFPNYIVSNKSVQLSVRKGRSPSATSTLSLNLLWASLKYCIFTVQLAFCRQK